MARPRAALSCLCLAIASLGCEQKPEVPVDDPQAFVEAAIRDDPTFCPFERAEYCLDELVGPAIETELDSVQYRSKLEGKLPTTDRQLNRFADSAKRRYRRMHLEDEERRAAVLAKMKDHYEGAPAVRKGDHAYVDLGTLPTGFRQWRQRWVLGTESPLLDGFSWRSTEIAEQFARMREAEPDAESYTIRIRVPRGTSVVELVLTWYPSSEKIAVRDQGQQWATKAAVGSDLQSLRASGFDLFDELQSCVRGGAGCPSPASWPNDL